MVQLTLLEREAIKMSVCAANVHLRSALSG